MKAERHHWLNTFVGILDDAFHLTDEEQFHVINDISELFGLLNIPDRSEPTRMSAPLAVEVASGIYTERIHGPRDGGFQQHARAKTSSDLSVSLETWRESFTDMIFLSYPDLDNLEKLASIKVFTDLLTSLGVPHRAASFFPNDVVNISQDTP